MVMCPSKARWNWTMDRRLTISRIASRGEMKAQRIKAVTTELLVPAANRSCTRSAGWRHTAPNCRSRMGLREKGGLGNANGGWGHVERKESLRPRTDGMPGVRTFYHSQEAHRMKQEADVSRGGSIS